MKPGTIFIHKDNEFNSIIISEITDTKIAYTLRGKEILTDEWFVESKTEFRKIFESCIIPNYLEVICPSAIPMFSPR